MNIPVSFFEKYIYFVDWKYLCKNTNIPASFFEKHLDKVHWDSLCCNTNIPVSFFEKNLNKINWDNLCLNTNIPVTFFNNHLDKINWIYLSSNNFGSYFQNFEIQENKTKMTLVFEEINTFVYLVPPKVLNCLPKGGSGYLEMLSRYEIF